jgi:hypothetical protein
MHNRSYPFQCRRIHLPVSRFPLEIGALPPPQCTHLMSSPVRAQRASQKPTGPCYKNPHEELAPPAGLEPATLGLGNRRSIQLSYGGPRASCEMLPVLGSLLASVDAHQIASGVAGVNAAVGKDGDGPAAALQDRSFSGGVESLGGGWGQGEIAGFSQDE